MTPSRTARGAALAVSLVALIGVTAVGVALLRSALATSTESSRGLDAACDALAVETLTPALLEWAGPAPRIGEGFALSAERTLAGAQLRVYALDLSGRLHLAHLREPVSIGLPVGLGDLASDAARSAASLATERLKDEGGGAPPVPIEAALHRATPDMAARAAIYPRDVERGASDAACFWMTGCGSGRLNLNAAPIDLLRAALRGRDPSAARDVIRLRERGAPVTADLVARLNTGRSVRPELTLSSDSYGFLVEITRGSTLALGPSPDQPVHRSPARRWWIAAERGPEGWRIVERRRIP